MPTSRRTAPWPRSGSSPALTLRELERAVAGGDAIRLVDAVAPSAYRAPRRPSGALSGTVTFLFTDIEGSTRLWETAPAAMEGALARHDVILRGAVDEHGGVVFATGGDGLAAAFGRAGDAVVAAVDAQRRLQAEPWPEATPLRVRMGLHTGEAQERDGDFFGPPVNRAARITAAAHGGQIVVSGATAGVLGPLSGGSNSSISASTACEGWVKLSASTLFEPTARLGATSRSRRFPNCVATCLARSPRGSESRLT